MIHYGGKRRPSGGGIAGSKALCSTIINITITRITAYLYGMSVRGFERSNGNCRSDSVMRGRAEVRRAAASLVERLRSNMGSSDPGRASRRTRPVRQQFDLRPRHRRGARGARQGERPNGLALRREARVLRLSGFSARPARGVERPHKLPADALSAQQKGERLRQTAPAAERIGHVYPQPADHVARRTGQ